MEQLVSRVSQSPAAPLGTIHYIYDLDGHLIAEANGSTGAVTRVYIWLPANDNSNDTLAEDMGLAANDNTAPDLPLAVVDIAGTTHTILQVHTDHLGRPTRMTNAAKATVWSASYKPWGEVQAITGSATQNLRFPGQYFQIETGLAYNWHRTYDPVTGRYTQPDPLGFVDGPSVFAYAGSSPYMNVDRDGRETWTWGANGSFVPGLGLEGSIGIFFNLGDPTTGECFDFGIYGSGGIAAGVNIGVGGQASYSDGPASSINGVSVNGSVGAGFVSVNGLMSADGRPQIGGGIGVGATPVSASIGLGYTGSVGYQTFKSIFDWATGGGSACGCKR
jgi:RHS repeat-associated protein